MIRGGTCIVYAHVQFLGDAKEQNWSTASYLTCNVNYNNQWRLDGGRRRRGGQTPEFQVRMTKPIGTCPAPPYHTSLNHHEGGPASVSGTAGQRE